MNILFDLITPQAFIGGAGEYVRRVYNALLKANVNSDVHVIGIFDSKIKKFSYDDLNPINLDKKVVDINGTNLHDIIVEYKIDTIFIGALQYWEKYSFQGVDCKIIAVVHDLCTEEYNRENLTLYANLHNTKKTVKIICRKFINRVIKFKNRRFDSLLMREKIELITVSNYSKYTLIYNYPQIKDKIDVLYSPSRIEREEEAISNFTLNLLIESNRPFFLMLGCDREMKNCLKALHAFKRYTEIYSKEISIVTVGCNRQFFKNHIPLPYLSESDLRMAYKNCHAFIFPSYFEGFGYPPVEAMKYAKPILASNTTSIPEICGDAPIYFSPLYESDIFKAIITFEGSDYQYFAKKSIARYKSIYKRQENDLEKLINKITAI